MEELKLCAHCGGRAELVQTSHYGSFVICMDCGIMTDTYEDDYIGKGPVKAMEIWNRRAKEGES